MKKTSTKRTTSSTAEVVDMNAWRAEPKPPATNEQPSRGLDEGLVREALGADDDDPVRGLLVAVDQDLGVLCRSMAREDDEASFFAVEMLGRIRSRMTIALSALEEAPARRAEPTGISLRRRMPNDETAEDTLGDLICTAVGGGNVDLREGALQRFGEELELLAHGAADFDVKPLGDTAEKLVDGLYFISTRLQATAAIMRLMAAHAVEGSPSAGDPRPVEAFALAVMRLHERWSGPNVGEYANDLDEGRVRKAILALARRARADWPPKPASKAAPAT